MPNDRTHTGGYTSAKKLSDDERATLESNWEQAGEALDHLLALDTEHRLASYCADWFCGSEELNQTLTDLSYEQVHMIMRVAMQRLQQAAAREATR